MSKRPRTKRSVARMLAACESNAKAKARRDSCVNALAGIPDPAAFVSAVRAAVAAGAVDEIHLTLIREAMNGK